MSMLMLIGCGRRELPGSKQETDIVRFQLDAQQTQRPQLTPTPGQSASIPAATPQTAGKSASEKPESDADTDTLMDELETTLNELEETIAAADRDTMTDSDLIALGQ